jgi:phosphatidate cytidylyltransferase
LFWLPLSGWWGFCACIAAAAAWEWAGLFRLEASLRLVYGVFVGLLVFLFEALSSNAADIVVFGVSVLFWVLCAPIWLKSRWQISRTWLALLCGLVVLVPAALALARLRGHDPWLLLAICALVWVADIGAYFGGRAFGKRKLAPQISPGKSWEGVWSGFAAVLIYGTLVFAFKLEPVPATVGWPIAILSLAVLLALSVEGDLFESLLKRQAGLKDSSNLLPGHGGVLDRIDSLTSTLPLAALWAALWPH